MKNAVFKVVISGSFRKHYREIVNTISSFETEGFEVLSPRASKILNPGADFVILESDAGRNPDQIERSHLDAIYEADALYVVNPGGYIGNAGALEIGWALGFCKPIFFAERCSEDLFNNYGHVLPDIRSVRDRLIEREGYLPSTICKFTPLEQLQKYIHKVVVKRGFDKETTRDILLLMLEEVGELAKAVRKFSGLKVDPTKQSTRGNLDEELADVLIYLLDLANSCKIDLFSAFLKKETQNEKRSWTSEV